MYARERSFKSHISDWFYNELYIGIQDFMKDYSHGYIIETKNNEINGLQGIENEAE